MLLVVACPRGHKADELAKSDNCKKMARPRIEGQTFWWRPGALGTHITTRTITK